MPPARISLDALNAAPNAEFVRHLGEIFEHAPWVAEQASNRRGPSQPSPRCMTP